MKKRYLSAVILVLSLVNANAQDTIVFENFNSNAFYTELKDNGASPPANSSDTLWYTYDEDGLSAQNSTVPSGGWYQVLPFSYVDTAGNSAIGANSWFVSPAAASNWLISPSFILGAHDTLFWKSAPSQTPRYLDGYKVKISTTTNEDLAFTTTLFTAAEMTGLSAAEDSVYANFTFSTGFVHGLDGTYIDPVDPSAAHILHNGRLQPFSYPLDAYAGQTIFIAFHHDSFDDNQISIDDFMIRGTASPTGINEYENGLGLNIFPNPSNDYAQVNYSLPDETNVIITIYDVAGKLIVSENKGVQQAGRHFSAINTAAMAKGFYTVSVQTNSGRSTAKMIVK